MHRGAGQPLLATKGVGYLHEVIIYYNRKMVSGHAICFQQYLIIDQRTVKMYLPAYHIGERYCFVLRHFQSAPELERLLEQRLKHDLLEVVRYTNNLARFSTAHQHEPLGLGHAVLQAQEAVGDEPFAVMLPDDIFDGPTPCLRQLLDIAESEDAPVVALTRVAPSEVSKYGIVAVKTVRPRLHQLIGMVEKPPLDQAPSDLAIMGRYVLTPDNFPLLAAGKPGAGGEIQLTDGLLALSKRRKVYGYEFEGVRYDLGDRIGFLTAQIGFGLKRPELADRLRAWLKTALSS